MKLNLGKFRNITWHIIFWSLFFLYTFLTEGTINDKNYTVAFYMACTYVVLGMFVTYFTLNITLGKYYFKKQHVQFVLCLLLSFILSGVARRYFLYTYIYPVLSPDKLAEPLFYIPKIIVGAVQVHLIAAVGTLIYLLGRWKEQQHFSDILVKEKVAAELQLLKSQVQPHFIFNTLNNIYMLSLKGSNQTSDMIYRLSSLLSYMLYDSKEDVISIEKEIDYIKNYINLEKIRYGERLDVQLNVYKAIKSINLPPLLFLPLVENAFKHGVSKQVNDSWVHIDISLKKGILIFKIENSCSDDVELLKEFGHGLGLDNLRKRLQIIYNTKYELKTMKEDDTYLAVLKLDLSDSILNLDIAPDKKEPKFVVNNEVE